MASRGGSELSLPQLVHLAGQYLKVRSVKRAVIVISLSLLVALWIWGSRKPRATSAVGCKNRLAEIIKPIKSERKSYLEAMGNEVHSIEDHYFHFMTSTERMCYDQVHIGPSEDGGWEVCLDPRFSFKSPCLVYSFGVGNDFRFEKGIEKLLGCEVHAFDPSMGVASHQYSDKGHFYNIGIDNVDSYAVGNTWKMRTLSTIIKMLQHEERTIDYMKMDVEFSEWPALYQMIESGTIKKIRQLAVEFHTPEVDIHEKPDHRCTWSTRETLAAMMRILHDLRREGFSVFYTRTNYRTLFKSGLTNRERYCCYDVHLVNMKHPENAWVPPPGS